MQDEVRKSRAPKLVFEPGAEGWLTLERNHETHVNRALASQIRREIYDELDSGPINHVMLAKRVSKKLGKKLSNALLRHHLRKLEMAGLIGFESNSEMGGKVKIIFRKADARVQLKPRETPFAMKEPKTREEFETELKRMFRNPPLSQGET